MNDPLDPLFAGQILSICREPDGSWNAAATRPTGLVPGAFNPLHDGHRQLAAVATRLLGGPVAFELSVLNVEKPPLTDGEVMRRLKEFVQGPPVWLTRAATFQEKAQLFPQTVFVVGADTAARIVAARFYGESFAEMCSALDGIARRGCRFRVAGRADTEGRFLELEHLPIPPEYAYLFESIPQNTYQCDISSTRIRNSQIGKNFQE
jgi:hypothetical protein